MKIKNTGKKTLEKGRYTFNCAMITRSDLDDYMTARLEIEKRVGLVDVSSRQMLVYLCRHFNGTNTN